MNITKLRFESENLVVHYICFNMAGYVELEDIKKIAFYLYESFGFNSAFINYDRIEGWQTKPLFYDSTNLHTVSFHQFEYNPQIKSYWVGTQIHFTGDNGTHFYNRVKKNQFDWGILDGLKPTLSRIDVCCFRETKRNDTNELVEDFMKKCCKKVKSKDKRRKADYTLEENGWVLKIGARKSPKHYRVYENKQGLRFELEVKKGLAKSFQKLLMDNRFQKLENDLSKLFYSQSFDSLSFNSCYTHWLIHWYRIRLNQKGLNRFNTSYFKINNLLLYDNKKLIFDFFRILSFIRNKEYIKQTFKIDDDAQTFYVVNFRLVDFLRFIKLNEKNHRHRTNIIEIFKEFEYIHKFQLQSFRTTLNDCLSVSTDEIEFTSVIMIPFLKIKKQKNIWYVIVLVAKQFYEYNFPFQFKDYFLTIYQFQVKSQIIAITATDSLKKEFYIQEFLKRFNVPNKKKTQLKQMLIEAIYQQINNQLIQTQFKIIQKDGSIKKINKLQTQDISQIKLIYFYENVDYKSLFQQK